MKNILIILIISALLAACASNKKPSVKDPLNPTAKEIQEQIAITYGEKIQ